MVTAWLMVIALCVTAVMWRRVLRWSSSVLHTLLLARRLPGPGVHVNLFLAALDGVIPAILRQFDQYGPVVRLWVGPFLFVLLKAPEDIQQVLGNPRLVNRDSYSIGIFKSVFGESLLTTQDDAWRTHRKLITPAFSVQLLQTYVGVFGRKAAILVEKLREVCDGRTLDIHRYLALCTLDAICETAIGTEVNTQTIGQSDLADSIDDATGLVVRRFPRIWLHLDALYSMTSEGKRAKHNLKIFHSFSEGVIAQKLKEFRNGVHSPSVILASETKVSSFLEMLIEASETQGSILSPDEIRDEVTAMALTGIGGPTTVMSMLLVLVAMYPEIQDRLQQELVDVFGTDSRVATSEDIHRLAYLDRCITETMRLFPVCPSIFRELNEDLQLASGYVLPAGCQVIVVPFATHRDPHYFPDPLRFWPDRWLPENVVHSHPYAYLPFSAGVRTCIGQRYANLQMKSVLSLVLREFSVSTKIDQDTLTRGLQLALVLAVKKELGYPVQLTRRTRSTC